VTLRIGNASGFYGDRFSAVREMLTGGPLDVLTGDYLAELTMLILGRDRLKDAGRGYARTFLRQLEENLGLAVERGVKIVTNAGGLNPAGLAEALRELSHRLGIEARIAYVHRGFVWGSDASTGQLSDGAGMKAPAASLRQSVSPSLALVPYHELLHRYHTRRRAVRLRSGRAMDTFLDFAAGVGWRAGGEIGFLKFRAIHVNCAIFEVNGVATDANDAFDGIAFG